MKIKLLVILMSLSNLIFSQNKSKEDIIKSSIGVFELNSISGVRGANTMVDFYKEKGSWKWVETWLSRGERVGELERVGGLNKIKPRELRKLNSMKIIVNSDLSISLRCNEKIIIKFPFKKAGIVYELKNVYEKGSRWGLEEIKPETIFKDSMLFLFVKDNIKDSEIQPYDLAETGGEIIIIYYSIKGKEFKVVLCNSGFNDNSVYTFKRKK